MPYFVLKAADTVVINEVIARNQDVGPRDIDDGTPDMVEIYNASSEEVTLGEITRSESYLLSDRDDFDDARAWRFPVGVTIQPEEFLIVYCDGDVDAGFCELHATFQVSNDGDEPVTLWGPEDANGVRTKVDRVFLPPMRANVSYGRFPDGAGPAPLPLEETLDVLRANELGTDSPPTFGFCTELNAFCVNARKKRRCVGEPNNPGTNLRPRIVLESVSTIRPAAGEPVEVIARVSDDKEPLPGNIASVNLHYSVNEGSPQEIAMVYDAGAGLRDGGDRCSRPDLCLDEGQVCRNRPLDRWTLWKATIPGQAADVGVLFHFSVTDEEERIDFNPRLCPPGVGPCNSIGLPGKNCEERPGSDPVRFLSCRLGHHYMAGFEPPKELAGVVINEVMSEQSLVLRDLSECDSTNTDPGCYDDYIELYNAGEEEADLTGCWLSDDAVDPWGWPFPDGTVLEPGDRILVWADGDGGRCPRPPEVLGDGQECPDPTNLEMREFHTNFSLNRDGDEVYLWKQTAEGFGMLDRVEFGCQEENVALSLCPDGDRSGEYVLEDGGSPEEPNSCVPDKELFMRGDSNSDCDVGIADAIFALQHLFASGAAPLCPDAMDADDDGSLLITDGIFTLNYLFAGGETPPAPGPETAGEDPTEDDLGPCGLATCLTVKS